MVYGDKLYRAYAPLFPTPDDIPLETTPVTIHLPQSPAWTGLWIGVLLTLTEPEMFQEFDGGISRETTAEIFKDALIDALLAPAEELSEPFWDDPEGDDASSGAENPEFPFYEDVANFAIAGFVLYASGSPTTALQYWTVARQFRLKYRKNPLGGLIKIFMDGVLLDEVDTYAATPELGYVDIGSTGSILRLEFPSEGTITEIIRKQLWEGEITGDLVRWHEGHWQINNGGTWEDNDAADPREQVAWHYAPSGGDDPHCLSAVNLTAKFEAMINAFLLATSTIDAANAIVGIILVFFPPARLLWAIIIAVIEALYAIGVFAINAAFNFSAYDQLKCIIYDEIDSDGSIDTAAKDAIYDRIEAEMSPVQFAVLSLLINALGTDGMNNAAQQREETGDCSACGWCYEFDFSGGQQGFTMKYCGSTAQYGSYSGGAFSQAVYGSQKILWLYKTWTPVSGTITSIEITTVNDAGTMITYRAGCTNSSALNPTSPSANHFKYTLGWDETLGYIYMNWITGLSVPTLSITKMKFRGDGTNPFGTDNC